MRKFVLFSMILFTGFQLSAQNQRVSGTVTDPDGLPVVGATVIVAGSTSNAALTEANGRYSIMVPANGNLQFSFLGLATRVVPVNGRSIIDVRMEAADALAIENVVVTALGISRVEKTLGYSATTVSSEDIVTARTTNVANALSGRVAGVQVSTTSSDPGSVSNIIIRGFSSINGNNQPLYVVDGVPMQSNMLSGYGKNVTTGGIANLSAEDIESMTILKGAAATALYGSRAANGVIQISTKSGKKGDGRNFSINYSGNVQLTQVSLLPEMQNQFGQGWNGAQTFIENGSWGPALDGSMQVYGPVWSHQQLLHEYSAKENNVRDFFELGVSQNHSVALSGVSEDAKMDYYGSFSYSKDDGIMPGDYDNFKRTTLAFRSSYQAVKWMKVSSSINFARNATDAVGTFQGTSVIDGLYEMPRDVSIVDMKDTSSPFNTPEAYFTPYGITNPYWALENNYFHTDSKQIYGKVQIDINPIKELTLTYRMGFDYTDNDSKIGEPKINLDDLKINNDYGYAPKNMNQPGLVWASYGRRYELNHDFLAGYSNRFLDDRLEFGINIGANINERASTAMTAETSNLTFYSGYWQLNNGTTKVNSEVQSMRRLVGLLGDVTVGWDDMIYLNLTARNDWSSTLPIGNNSFFYPGATLSWIFTELVPRNNVLSFGKLRLAYGKTGNDAEPYRTGINYVQGFADGYYGLDISRFPMNGANAFLASATLGSPSLGPEMTSEFEVGVNLQFFTGRLGIDAAFYNRVSNNQILALPVEPASGYSAMMSNFGQVRNRGIEVLLNTVPVRTKNFQWTLDLNFAKNNNMVVSLPETLEGGKVALPNRYAAGNDAVYMYAEQGKPIGQYYTYLPQYTDDGKLIVDMNGQPVIGTEVEDTGKNMNNKWIGGLATALTWKSITLSAAVDIRQGGWMFSRTRNLMQFTGNGIETTYNGRNPFIIPNSVMEVKNGAGEVTGYVENTTPIYPHNGSYQAYFDAGYGNGGNQFLVDRSFVKLRNISLTWDLPQKWVNAISLSGIALTAYCNNVFTWTASSNTWIDPESTTYSQSLSGDLGVQFGESYANPSSRIYGCNLSIKF